MMPKKGSNVLLTNSFDALFGDPVPAPQPEQKPAAPVQPTVPPQISESAPAPAGITANSYLETKRRKKKTASPKRVRSLYIRDDLYAALDSLSDEQVSRSEYLEAILLEYAANHPEFGRFINL